MPQCPICGASIPEHTRFCPKCGASADHARTPPASWGKAAFKTAGLLLVILALAIGGFRLVTRPRQTSPTGTLALFLEGVARRDGRQVAQCMDLTEEERAVLNTRLASPYSWDWLLIDFLNQNGTGLPSANGSLFGYRIGSVEIVTSASEMSNYAGTACTVQALLRIRPAEGPLQVYELRGVTMTHTGGLWYLSL